MEIAGGERFGSYRIESRIGQGAMGTVYRASGDDRSEPVALKILRAELAQDPEYRQRFLHEARAATTITHPHLVTVLDAGEVEGLPFLAMPLVAGEPLDVVLRARGPLRPEQVVRIATEIGSALDALHAAGLMHRDVKPANILIEPDGRSALTDFGLAKGETGYQTVTAAGMIVGTVAYVAPERIRGERATPASDVYALGCTVFECLTGAPPFAGPTQMTVLVGHLQEEPPNPSWQRSDLTEPFGEAVIGPLSKDAAARPRSATEYARLLRDAQP